VFSSYVRILFRVSAVRLIFTSIFTPGGYALAGQDAGLAFNRVLSADSGSYALAGQDVTLTYTPIGGATYTLAADSGSFTLTGQDTGLAFNRVLVADSGSYTLTGQDATLGAPLFTQAQLDYMLAYCQANLTGLLKRWNGSAWV
jgi:large exoprotein involved in heme utilization and adhesion